MPFSSLSFGQFCDFRPKVCFFASGSKRFEFPFSSRLDNSYLFYPLSRGYFCFFVNFWSFSLYLKRSHTPEKLPFKLTKKTKISLTQRRKIDGISEPDENGKISNHLDPDAEKQTFERKSQKWPNHFTRNQITQTCVLRPTNPL
ncbi:hypothetical protein Hanom_Chr08g00725131 [Helianthus anomalus]